MRKLKLIKIKYFAQDHLITKWQSWGFLKNSFMEVQFAYYKMYDVHI